ncbi:TolC family protein [Segatella bryantii]|uniref:TolC family protein n=1 Tax=Segatella bryantii TaxID=77095 RepID=UPI001EDB240D|nr:TolC family protein [Segatella bryantii]UKK73556.1 TolC family protein [Segatella bryantii]
MNITKFNIVFLIMVGISNSTMAQGLLLANTNKVMTLTFEKAKQMMREHHLLLLQKKLDIEKAEAQLKQSRLYENPTIEAMYNINNPVTHRYFDSGYEGEIDIQISQPIAIGGQHSQQVKSAHNQLESTKYEFIDTERECIAQLYAKLIELYYTQKKQVIYSQELHAIQQVINAYQEENTKGNISHLELQRIKSMYLQLQKEAYDFLQQEQTLERDIKLMIGITDDDDKIRPTLNEDNITEQHIQNIHINELLSLAKSRPDLVAQGYDVKASEHEVKYQKAIALPIIALQGEYDKNGSIGHNTYLVGLSVTVPIFNHNQGNIKKAKSALQQAVISKQMKNQQIEADVTTYYNLLCTQTQQVQELKQLHNTPMKQQIDQVKEQYLKRNISLLEFIDLYTSFKDTYLAEQDIKNQLIQTVNELNTTVGTEIIKIK